MLFIGGTVHWQQWNQLHSINFVIFNLSSLLTFRDSTYVVQRFVIWRFVIWRFVRVPYKILAWGELLHIPYFHLILPARREDIEVHSKISELKIVALGGGRSSMARKNEDEAGCIDLLLYSLYVFYLLYSMTSLRHC